MKNKPLNALETTLCVIVGIVLSLCIKKYTTFAGTIVGNILTFTAPILLVSIFYASVKGTLKSKDTRQKEDTTL